MLWCWERNGCEVYDGSYTVICYNERHGPSIQRWLSDKSPQHPWLCMLKKDGAQNLMLTNEITDVVSKNKRKYNTMAEDEVKRKNISKSIKNEKENLDFLVEWFQLWR